MDIENEVKKIFLKHFSDMKEDDFDFDKTQDQFLNWDSLAHMELVYKVEEKFGIQIDMDEIMSIEKPIDFVNIIKSKIK